MKSEYKHRRTDVDQTSQFVKYFRDFWPYPLKDKIKAGVRTRHFTLVTNRILVENVKRLALMETMTTNEFLVKVISDFVIQELEDPLMDQHIPEY